MAVNKLRDNNFEFSLWLWKSNIFELLELILKCEQLFCEYNFDIPGIIQSIKISGKNVTKTRSDKVTNIGKPKNLRLS
jgi:hypothetical protein